MTEPNARPETGRYAARHADCYNYHIIKITHIRLLFALGVALAPLAPAYAQTTSANLGWDPDTSPSVAGYRLHTGTSSGVYTQTTEVGNVTAAAVSNLTTGKTYYFVVTAYNKGLVDGPPSNEVSFIAGSTPTPTPIPSATPTPIAPTNLAAAAASSSQINLSWIDRANNETGFKIERSKDGTTFSQISTVGANTIAYNSSGLVASTKYYYRVRAYNSSGSSPYSNVSSATTMAASSPTPTPTPTPSPTPTATPTPSATVDTPTISPASGTFKKRVTIRLSCTTAGATIYYTLDGTNPTTASAAYFIGKRKSKGIRIVGVGSHTVKAKAAKNGYNDSAIATANLTLY